MDMPRTILLTPGDVPDIIDLEAQSFAPSMQANVATIMKRFELGHVMIGIREDGALVAMLSLSYSRFSPDEFDSFPKVFGEFSMRPPVANPNAVFVYNLEVAKRRRGRAHAAALLQRAWALGKGRGCTYAVGDGRISSYTGSVKCDQERVRHQPTLALAINRHLDGGPFPSDRELLTDPTLALYRRLTGCHFLWIIPNFIPEDHAAGGIRVIIFGLLDEAPERGWHGPNPGARVSPDPLGQSAWQ